MAENEGMGQAQNTAVNAQLSAEAVFEKYRERIYRYILRLVRDPSDADDLLQETFLTVHRRLPSLREQAALSAWLYRIATNLSYDHLRRTTRLRTRKVEGRAGEEETGAVRSAEPGEPGLDTAFERADMSTCVQEFVADLSDDYRTVIMLHDLQGLTNAEIAGILGCSLDTVKIRLHRARQKLKAALNQGCAFAPDERGVLTCDRRPRSPVGR